MKFFALIPILSRYADPADPSLVLIYDDAGYIAGVQGGLRESDIDQTVFPVATLPAYQVTRVLNPKYPLSHYITT